MAWSGPCRRRPRSIRLPRRRSFMQYGWDSASQNFYGHRSVEELEAAFIKANPGLSADAISVTCDSRRLSEVRICMSKDLQFRPCEENDRRACKRDQVLMPPVRGG